MENETEYKITKSTVELYKLRHESGMYWADITIDNNGSSGRIQIASDFGSWQYYWSHCGKPFKEFLTKIGIDYVSSKFKEDRWFDFDQTIKEFKRNVIELRRQSDLSSESARELFDDIKELEEGGAYDEAGLYMAMNDSDKLMEFFNHSPHFSHDISPAFRKFWKTAWQAFIAELKSEKLDEVLQ